MRGLVRGGWETGLLLCLATALVAAAADRDEKKPEAAGKGGATADSAPPTREEARAASLEALGALGNLVGEWRGAGRPRRNSNAGAWIEKGEWVWEIRKEQVGLRYNVKEGKQIATALLTYDPVKREYRLEATFDDKSTRRYAGTLADNRLSLVSLPDEKGESPGGKVHQLDIRQLSEKRVVLLYQSRLASQQQLGLVAEVGYTREGTKLAEEGSDGPECIVTGGKGTSTIVYKGKTYWFCCTGCRDAFNDDPEGIIAEAAQRAAKKKAGAKR